MPLISYYTPRGFLMFSGGTERDQWHEFVKQTLQTKLG